MYSKHHRTRVTYTSDSAQAYGTLGIAGTTYEIGFAATKRLLGSINGAVLLDFGAGAGRSSQFLRNEGAAQVFAVDHNKEMISEGKSRAIPGVDFVLSDERIPLPDECADGAASLNVFIEFSMREPMLLACKEVYRVLRAGGRFVVATTNPSAFGHKFRSFEYAQPKAARSGSTAICKVSTTIGVLELEDTYWTELDYRWALSEAGFLVTAVEYPLGEPTRFPETDESSVAPFVVLAAVKAQSSCGQPS